MAKQHAGKPLEAKIATVVAVTLILYSVDLRQAAQQLQHLTNGQKDYFDHELAVIELAVPASELAQLDWPALLALLRQWQLNPVAVRNAPTGMHAQLHELGLSIDEVAARASESAAVAASTPASALAAPPAAPAAAAAATTTAATAAPAAKPAPAPAQAAASAPCMIIDTPVRGGQRIYARGADLVVTAIVNPGAELIADGSIHVYAPLRGRALAGAAGATGARIFALEMAPELVSIAGIYRTFEDGAPAIVAGGPAEVRLAGDRLDLRPISAREKNS